MIFTASVSRLANLILNKLDPDGNQIRHRLFREHCIRTDYASIKDLSRLGRPLERTVIIDNIERNFERQPENGIRCGTWIGSATDRELMELRDFLKLVARNRPSDIRPCIRWFKETIQTVSD